MTSLVPFISRADLGAKLGQDLSASDAALAAVDAACDICRTIAEQDFNAVSDDEVTLDGSGTDALLLPQLPVTEIDTVTEADEALIADDDYKLNGNGVLLRVKPGVWTKGRQNVVVTYSHGYADADFPRDVRMVALLIAERIFTAPRAGVSSETLGAYSVSYSSSSSSQMNDFITPGLKAILWKYRRAKSF